MKLILIVTGALLASAAHSEPALIRSGEHDDFSRLVLYTGKSQSWSMRRQEQLVSINIEGWNSGFDTSKIFTMIPKNRISKVSNDLSGITLTLECDCDVVVEPIETDGIMVDVRDEPEVASLALSQDATLETWPEREELILRSRNNETLSMFTRKLSESIAHAETQGVLIPVERRAPKARVSNGHPELSDTLRIRATSATQRAKKIRQDELPSHSICPPDNFGDIENWGTKEPYAQQIGSLRQSLVGEFDTLDEDRVFQLAKLYLYFAMGAEAKAVFETFAQTGHQVEFLSILGRFLDNPRGTEAAYDLPQNECMGTKSVWAALLGTSDELITEKQVKRITESFDRLPHHLKVILGPKLISRLQAEEHMAGAGVIRNSIAQNSSSSPSSQPSSRNFESLEAVELKNVIGRTDARTPDAIAAFIRQQIDQDTPLDATMRQVASSFVVQQKGDSIALELAMLLAKDSAIRGDYTDAVKAALDRSLEADASEILSFVVSRLLKEEKRSKVAKFALQLGSHDASLYLDREEIRKISDRLAAMELPRLARSFQALPPIDPQPDEAEILSTESKAMKTSRPEKTELTIKSAQDLLDTSREIRNGTRAALEESSRAVVE